MTYRHPRRQRPKTPYTPPPADYPPGYPPEQPGEYPYSETQPLPLEYVPASRQRRRHYNEPQQWMRRPRPRFSAGCCLVLVLAGLVGLLLAIYLLWPGRTNILVLGIDYTPKSNAVGRSDTMVLTTFIPIRPYVGMLSIPRDLWVNIPGFGENRINTAHFFAEAQQAGSGPAGAMETVRLNFGVDVDYFVRIRFEGFREVVNALGGVDIELSEPTAGYPAGRHHLTGNKALAFVRHRQGSDDFFRMENGQFIVKSVLKQMLHPLKWVRLPAVLVALNRSVDTNLPPWLLPRLGFALLRTGPDGIDSRTIRREMVTSFFTADGANVLAPDWGQINPLLIELFGQ